MTRGVIATVAVVLLLCVWNIALQVSTFNNQRQLENFETQSERLSQALDDSRSQSRSSVQKRDIHDQQRRDDVMSDAEIDVLTAPSTLEESNRSRDKRETKNEKKKKKKQRSKREKKKREIPERVFVRMVLDNSTEQCKNKSFSHANNLTFTIADEGPTRGLSHNDIAEKRDRFHLRTTTTDQPGTVTSIAVPSKGHYMIFVQFVMVDPMLYASYSVHINRQSTPVLRCNPPRQSTKYDDALHGQPQQHNHNCVTNGVFWLDKSDVISVRIKNVKLSCMPHLTFWGVVSL